MDAVKINIKLDEGVELPSYAKPGDAGMDLKATSMKKSGNWIFPLYTYGTGVSMAIPNTHYVKLVPRSSLSKKLMWLANHIGIIDSGYRGEIFFKFRSILGINPYKVGERIGQMVVAEKFKVNFVKKDELSTTERGAGGFGHTGK